MAEGKTGQIVRSVNLIHPLHLKQLQTVQRPGSGLLSGLKEKKDVAIQPLPLHLESRATQGRRVAVVAAEMGRTAFGQRQGVILRSKGY